ncbi:MAG: IspD/TarI family cytidylyltransferase [Acidimicrobiales bacterium]
MPSPPPAPAGPRSHHAPPNIAIVLAGGSGLRFGGDVNKVLVSIGGRPVIAYSLATFDRCERIDAIVIVIRSGDEQLIHEAVEASGITKLAAVVPGGATRQGSEWAGIQAAASLGHDGASVLLHDAARPFLTNALLDRIIDDAGAGGTIPTTPIGAPLIDPTGQIVVAGDLMRVQTPQAFPLALLLDVYPRAEADGFAGVDTAETMQHYGAAAARWVAGDERNIKVTHPDDRDVAEELARRFVDGVWSDLTDD